MKAYEAKMKAAGKSIEVQWFEAGHGSGDVALTIAQQESMMTFALGVLEEVAAGREKSRRCPLQRFRRTLVDSASF